MTTKQANLNNTGKRKSAIARLRMQAGKGDIKVNNKSIQDYFGHRLTIQKKIELPLELVGAMGSYDINVNVKGGGIVGQAEAVMYAIAKSLATLSEGNKTTLKAADLLTRNSLVKERKKYGRKKARKKFQFSKR